ncbi:MAG: alanine racemase [Deltaproteobacteria bacterium]
MQLLPLVLAISPLNYIITPAMRPTWAEIDISALKSNFRRVRERAGRGVCVLCVVKADAYGHGAVQVAKALVREGADMLGVATIAEALELRDSGISSPLVLLGGVLPEDAPFVVKADLTPALFSAASARSLSAAAHKFGKIVKYHLKIDTGMNRLGVCTDGVARLISEIGNLPNIEMEGVFTHFSHADSTNRDFTLRQISLFETELSALKKRGFNPLYIHLANSAAALRFPEAHGNLVRPGIMLYGGGGAELQPVMRFKTRVIQLKSIPAGASVSYGGTFSASRPSVIAVLPVGYADGYMRRLSNRARVSINGRLAPVVGAVCMDLIMIDVTDVPMVKEGDEVTLFGDELVSAWDVASWADTISYEIFTSVGRRVPRVYTSGGD